MRSSLVVDVLIVAALAEELDALLAVKTGRQGEWNERDGPIPYHEAQFESKSGSLRFVAAHLPKVGVTATAHTTGELERILHPRSLAMCGVCAGHPQNTSLGDVVIADRVFEHDEGKLRPTGLDGDVDSYRVEDSWVLLSRSMRGPARGMPGYCDASEDDAMWWLLEQLIADRVPDRNIAWRRYIPDEIRPIFVARLVDELGYAKIEGSSFVITPAGERAIFEHKARYDSLATKLPFHVHIGAIGSGSYVVADPELWARIARSGMRKILAIDMEAAAVGVVAHTRKLPFAVVKGVMDHGDTHKSDHFKDFAARASAEVLCKMLRRVLSTKTRVHEDEPRNRFRVVLAKSEEIGFDTHDQLEKLSLLSAEYEQRYLAGKDVKDIERQIIEIRRQVRRGPYPLSPWDFVQNQYRLIEIIGSGGFAQVWKAWDRQRHRYVAMKVLHGQWANDKSRIDRFLSGARRMDSLRHPAIAPILEVSHDDRGHYFYIMELYAEGDLRHAVMMGKITRHAALVAVARVLEGVAFAHSQGVIHRDVKPTNILLDRQQRGWLLDFDLAKAQDSTHGTRTAALGTFVYSAPEQLKDASRVDHRADLYSAGMCAIFVLTGDDPPPLVSVAKPDFLQQLCCTESLRVEISRAVEYSPDDRRTSCEKLATAILKEAIFTSVEEAERRSPVATPSDLKAADFQQLSRLKDILTKYRLNDVEVGDDSYVSVQTEGDDRCDPDQNEDEDDDE